MRYLLLSSIVAMLVWCGCAPKTQSSQHWAISNQSISIFTDTTGAYLYKNKIELYGHYLSGLMLIKPLPNHNYKVAMTTEFGAKIMDFEITDGELIMHDVIEQMNRKRILRMIEADMKLLFGIGQRNGVTASQSNQTVISFEGKPLNGEYTLDSLQHVIAIDGYRKKKKVVASIITDYQNDIPKTLRLSHLAMSVQMELTLIKAPGYVAE